MDLNTQTIVGILLVTTASAFTILVVLILVRFLNLKHLAKQPFVFLELTPPASSDKTPEATKQLFNVFHGLYISRSLKDKLLGRKPVFSGEIVSTKEHGIRYIMRIAQKDVAFFEKTVASYLPDAKFQQVDDYLKNVVDGKVVEFKQTGHFAYPLQSQDILYEHDPVAYLTGAMTKLEPDELVAFQIVASPTRVREAAVISNRLLHNEELLTRLGKQKFVALGSILGGLGSILFALLDGVGELFSSARTTRSPKYKDDQRRHDIAVKARPARTLTLFEYELAESVHDKLKQPLFDATIRIVVKTKGKHEQASRITDIKAALGVFSVPKFQALKAKRNLRQSVAQKLFSNRLPAVIRPSLFSSAELAALFHFPNTQTSKTENVVKSLSRTLPAPISLKNGTKFDVVLGQNQHHGTTTNIGLTTAERERHVYIIGGTGNGKTTLLQYAIVQDIQNGKGLAVVDPHGDMAEMLLRYVPEERINDVIYFNPDDLSYPIGLNMLELTPGLSGDELLREKDLVTESVISVFRKIFSDDDSGGHRIEYVLRNAIQTALTVEGATLFTVYNLLNDPKYCKKIVATLENEDLKNFWKNELGKAGGFQQVKMVAGITAKVGRFLFSASAKRILEQPKSTIDFDEVLNGKILICNFSKGLLGEDTSELFGITVLAKLQMAALRRARIQQDKRRPFYLYVDEFQNFATTSFIQMLSEARKYKLFLTMAEQSTSQQEELRMVNTILANVGTVICFRSGNPADEQMILPLFKPYIEEGEIANLPTFNFYARLSAIKSQEPLSGETLLLERNGNKKIFTKAIEASRQNHAIRYKTATPLAPPKIGESEDKQKMKFKAAHTAQIPGES